jgi:hypothetical protein
MPAQDLDLDGLQRLLWGFASHRVITVAGRTGILRLLAEKPLTTEDIASRLGLDPLATDKLVRALAALGIAHHTDGVFSAAPGVHDHFIEGERDIIPFLEHSHALYERWGRSLEPWLRGKDWEVAEKSPEELRRFGAAMRAMGGQIASRVAATLDLRGARRLLDVGGGWGQYARAMCRMEPGLTATVLDTPRVVEQARHAMAGHALEHRVEFRAGDYHETDFGTGYDLVLFANVLHQESAADAAELVRRGADALAANGRLVVVDFAIDNQRCEHLLGTLFAINMRSFGNTWTEPQIRGWMRRAGLGDVTCTPVGPDRWFIEGRKASVGDPARAPESD